MEAAGILMVKVAPPCVFGIVPLVGAGTVIEGVRGREELAPPEQAARMAVAMQVAIKRTFMKEKVLRQ